MIAPLDPAAAVTIKLEGVGVTDAEDPPPPPPPQDDSRMLAEKNIKKFRFTFIGTITFLS